MHYIVTGPLSVLEHMKWKQILSDVSVLNEVFWGLDLDKKVACLLFQRGIWYWALGC